MAGMLRSYELSSKQGKNASTARRIAAIARMHTALANSRYYNDKRENGRRRIKFCESLKEPEIKKIVGWLHRFVPEEDMAKIIEIEQREIGEYDNRGAAYWYTETPPNWKWFEWAFGEQASEKEAEWRKQHRRPLYRLVIHIRE